MTATSNRHARRPTAHRRRIRFSSLETLGFTDVATSWTDSPSPRPVTSGATGRHLAKPLEPQDVADWQPQDFGRRLTGSNVRWGLIIPALTVLGALGAVGFWFNQRPASIERAAETQLVAQARALESALPIVTELNQGLTGAEPVTGIGRLSSVEGVARSLFDSSGSLSQIDLRTAASQAASSALDGVRLVREVDAYRTAVLPMLDTPPLETDPEVILLDEAARSFGDWQLTFDNVRTALPEGVLPGITQELNILSGDLTSILGRYVDALRLDDKNAADGVLASLGARLDTIRDHLAGALADIQARTEGRVEETRAALGRILSG